MCRQGSAARQVACRLRGNARDQDDPAPPQLPAGCHRHLPHAGATETEFFERADVLDTNVGRRRTIRPTSPAPASRRCWTATATWWRAQNELRAVIANVTSAAILAEQHRKMAEPGSGDRK
jgi:hypothetical protein